MNVISYFIHIVLISTDVITDLYYYQLTPFFLIQESEREEHKRKYNASVQFIDEFIAAYKQVHGEPNLTHSEPKLNSSASPTRMRAKIKSLSPPNLRLKSETADPGPNLKPDKTALEHFNSLKWKGKMDDSAFLSGRSRSLHWDGGMSVGPVLHPRKWFPNNTFQPKARDSGR